jgi:hypothetical protein
MELAQNVTHWIKDFADGWGYQMPGRQASEGLLLALGMEPGADEFKKVLTSLFLLYTTKS